MLLWKGKITVLLLAFSLAFNLAFAAIASYYFISARQRAATETEELEEEMESARPLFYAGRRGERLQLSDEQREMLDARRKEFQRRLMEKRREAREIQARFFALLENPDTDDEEIAREAEEFHRVQQEMRRMIFDDLIELRGLLDSEQRRILGKSLTRRSMPRTSEDQPYRSHRRSSPDEDR